MSSSDHDHGGGCARPPQDAQSDLADGDRTRNVRRVFLLTLGLNLAVAIAKAAYAYLSGSVALGTDALHSVLDGSSNVLGLLALRWAARPADRGHPYGHTKAEILAAVGIAVLIVISLFEFAAAAIHSLLGYRAAPRIGWAGFVVVLGTVAVNTVVSWYEHRRGHELSSQLLCADAHHTRSDIYASGAVLASFLALRLGWGWADGLAGLLVIVLIGRAAWMVLRDNVPVLMDAAMLDPQHVIDLAGRVAGVTGVHAVRSRGARHAVHLDLHMQVQPDMQVADAHRLARQIEDELRRRFPQVTDVVIHTEPAPPSTPDPERPA